MAQKTIVQYVDDLDGSELDLEAATTRRFSIDGVEYEIDLSEKNSAKLDKALAPFVEAGRKLARNGKPYRRTVLKSKHDQAKVRKWAAENGYTVSDRGRIPKHVMEAYEAATA